MRGVLKKTVIPYISWVVTICFLSTSMVPPFSADQPKTDVLAANSLFDKALPDPSLPTMLIERAFSQKRFHAIVEKISGIEKDYANVTESSHDLSEKRKRFLDKYINMEKLIQRYRKRIEPESFGDQVFKSYFKEFEAIHKQILESFSAWQEAKDELENNSSEKVHDLSKLPKIEAKAEEIEITIQKNLPKLELLFENVLCKEVFQNGKNKEKKIALLKEAVRVSFDSKFERAPIELVFLKLAIEDNSERMLKDGALFQELFPHLSLKQKPEVQQLIEEELAKSWKPLYLLKTSTKLGLAALFLFVVALFNTHISLFFLSNNSPSPIEKKDNIKVVKVKVREEGKSENNLIKKKQKQEPKKEIDKEVDVKKERKDLPKENLKNEDFSTVVPKKEKEKKAGTKVVPKKEVMANGMIKNKKDLQKDLAEKKRKKKLNQLLMEMTSLDVELIPKEVISKKQEKILQNELLNLEGQLNELEKSGHKLERDHKKIFAALKKRSKQYDKKDLPNKSNAPSEWHSPEVERVKTTKEKPREFNSTENNEPNILQSFFQKMGLGIAKTFLEMMEPDTLKSLVESFMENSDPSIFKNLMGDLDPDVLKDFIENLDSDTIKKIMGDLDPNLLKQFMNNPSSGSVKSMMNQLSPKMLKNIIDKLDPSIVRTLMGKVDPEILKNAMEKMDPHILENLIDQLSKSKFKTQMEYNICLSYDKVYPSKWVGTLENTFMKHLVIQMFDAINIDTASFFVSSKEIGFEQVNLKGQPLVWGEFPSAKNILILPNSRIAAFQSEKNVSKIEVHYAEKTGQCVVLSKGVVPDTGRVRIGFREAVGNESEKVNRLIQVKGDCDKFYPKWFREGVLLGVDLSVKEREEFKNEILNRFYFSNNPNIQTAFDRSKRNFFEVVFNNKGFAFNSEGFALMDAWLSHELRLPCKIVIGYLSMGQGQNKQFSNNMRSAWTLGKGGKIQDSSRRIDITSYHQNQEKLFASKARLELKKLFLNIKIKAIKKKLSKKKNLSDDDSSIEAIFKKGGEKIVYYRSLTKAYEKRLKKIQEETLDKKTAYSLFQFIKKVSFKDADKDPYKFMARSHYLFSILEVLKNKTNYFKSKTIRKAKTDLFEKIVKISEEKGLDLKEPFVGLKLTDELYSFFKRTQIDSFVLENGIVKDVLTGAERKRPLSKGPLDLVDYSQGLFVYKTPSKRYILGGDKAKGYSDRAFKSIELYDHIFPYGNWLAKVQYLDGRWGLIGSAAEEFYKLPFKYFNFPYDVLEREKMIFNPSASNPFSNWMIGVQYQDSQYGFIGPLAETLKITKMRFESEKVISKFKFTRNGWISQNRITPYAHTTIDEWYEFIGPLTAQEGISEIRPNKGERLYIETLIDPENGSWGLNIDFRGSKDKYQVVGPLGREGVRSIRLSNRTPEGDWIGVKIFTNGTWTYFGPLAPDHKEIYPNRFEAPRYLYASRKGWIGESPLSGPLSKGFEGISDRDISAYMTSGLEVAPNGQWLVGGISHYEDFSHILEGPPARKFGLNKIRGNFKVSKFSRGGSWAVDMVDDNYNSEYKFGFIRLSFIQRLLSLHGKDIESVKVFDYLTDQRMDRRWVNIFDQSKRYPEKAKEAFEKLIREIFRNPSSRFFDHEIAQYLILMNKDFFCYAVSDLKAEDIKALVSLFSFIPKDIFIQCALVHNSLDVSHNLLQGISEKEIKKWAKHREITLKEKHLGFVSDDLSIFLSDFPYLTVNKERKKVEKFYQLLQEKLSPKEKKNFRIYLSKMKSEINGLEKLGVFFPLKWEDLRLIDVEKVKGKEVFDYFKYLRLDHSWDVAFNLAEQYPQEAKKGLKQLLQKINLVSKSKYFSKEKALQLIDSNKDFFDQAVAELKAKHIRRLIEFFNYPQKESLIYYGLIHTSKKVNQDFLKGFSREEIKQYLQDKEAFLSQQYLVGILKDGTFPYLSVNREQQKVKRFYQFLMRLLSSDNKRKLQSYLSEMEKEIKGLEELGILFRPDREALQLVNMDQIDSVEVFDYLNLVRLDQGWKIVFDLADKYPQEAKEAFKQLLRNSHDILNSTSFNVTMAQDLILSNKPLFYSAIAELDTDEVRKVISVLNLPIKEALIHFALIHTSESVSQSLLMGVSTKEIKQWLKDKEASLKEEYLSAFAKKGSFPYLTVNKERYKVAKFYQILMQYLSLKEKGRLQAYLVEMEKEMEGLERLGLSFELDREALQLLDVDKIDSVKVFDYLDHVRLDQGWQIVFNLADRYPHETKEALKFLLQDIKALSKSKYFDSTKAKVLIDSNNSFFNEALLELDGKEIEKVINALKLPKKEIVIQVALSHSSLKVSNGLLQGISHKEVFQWLKNKEDALHKKHLSKLVKKGCLPYLSVNEDRQKIEAFYQLLKASLNKAERQQLQAYLSEMKQFMDGLERLGISFKLNRESLQLININQIKSAEIFDFLDHLRLDQVWHVVFNLAKEHPEKSKEALKKLLQGIYIDSGLKSFDAKKAKKLIASNQEFFYGAIGELSASEIRNFIDALHYPRKEKLIQLALIHPVLKVSEDLLSVVSSEEMKIWLQNREIALSQKHLSGFLKKGAFPYLTINKDSGKVEKFYQWLEGYLTPKEKIKVRAYLAAMKQEMIRLKELEIFYELKEGDFKPVFKFLHQKLQYRTGWRGSLLDVEIQEKEKGLLFSFSRLLQKMPTFLQFGSWNAGKRLRLDEHSVMFKKMNQELVEVLGEDFEGKHRSDLSLIEFLYQSSIVWGFLLGLIHLVFSLFYSEKLKREEKYLVGYSGKEILNHIFEENTWFNSKTNLQAEVIKKDIDKLLFYAHSDEVDKLALSEKQKAILDLLRFVAYENVFKGKVETRREKIVETLKNVWLLIPGLGALLRLGQMKYQKSYPDDFMQRQNMNYELLNLTHKIGKEIHTPEALYQELEKIGKKYQSLTGESTPVVNKKPVDVSLLKSQVLKRFKKKEIVMIPGSNSLSNKPNGSRGNRPKSDGYDFNKYKKYSSGDDIRHIDWQRSYSGRSLDDENQNLMVRQYDEEVKQQTSLLVDLSSLSEGLSRDRWVEELVLSIKAQFVEYRDKATQGDFEINSVLFLFADGSLKQNVLTPVKGERKNKTGRLIYQIIELIKDQVHQQGAIKIENPFIFERSFYNKYKNQRYVKRIKRIFERLQNEKLKKQLKANLIAVLNANPNLRGQNIYIVGATDKDLSYLARYFLLYQWKSKSKMQVAIPVALNHLQAESPLRQDVAISQEVNCGLQLMPLVYVVSDWIGQLEKVWNEKKTKSLPSQPSQKIPAINIQDMISIESAA